MKLCPKCRQELTSDNFCWTCSKDMTKEVEKEEKEQEERKRKIKEEREKNGRPINEISFFLVLISMFAFYPIGAIMALIFGEEMLKIVGLVLGILIFVVYLIYIFSVKDEDVKRIPEKTYEIIRAVIILSTIVGIIWLFVDMSNMTNGNKSSSEPKKYTACENKSNTYYKCSWSAWEDRCVCKQR